MAMKGVVAQLLLVAGLCLSGTHGALHAQRFDRVTVCPTAGRSNANFVRVAPNGDIVVAGEFSGSIDFDPGAGSTVLSTATDDGFILCLDSLHQFRWARHIDGSNTSNPISNIEVDAQGNVLFADDIVVSVDVDPGPGAVVYAASSGYRAYVAMLDPGGNFVDGLPLISDSGDVHISEFALDAAGNLVVAGQFSGTVDFDPSGGTYNLAPPQGETWAFLWKLDAARNLLWVKSFENALYDGPTSVEFTPQSEVVVAGNFHGNVDLDPGTAAFVVSNPALSSADLDAFVLKLDAAGDFVWGRVIRGTLDDRTVGAKVAASGEIYVPVYFHDDSLDVDPGPATQYLGEPNVSSLKMVLVKLDSSGNFLAGDLLQYGATVSSEEALDVDGEHVNIVGYYALNAEFNPSGPSFPVTGTLTSAYLHQRNLDVSHAFSAGFEGSSTSLMFMMSIDTTLSGKLVIAGYFRDACDFDLGADSVLVDDGQPTELFLLQLDPACPVANFVDQGGQLVATTSGATYEWLDCGTGLPVAGATQQRFTPILSGSYAVVVTANGCSDTSACASILASAPAALGQAWKLFPNPNAAPDGAFTIDLGAPSATAAVEITDLLGKVVQRVSFTDRQLLPMQLQAPQGCYLVRITTEQGTGALRYVQGR